jgi:hypothetical protein
MLTVGRFYSTQDAAIRLSYSEDEVKLASTVPIKKSIDNKEVNRILMTFLGQCWFEQPHLSLKRFQMP